MPAEPGTSAQVASAMLRQETAETLWRRDDRRDHIAAGDEALTRGIGGRFDGIATPPGMVRLTAGSVCCGHCGQTVDEAERVCPGCGRGVG